MNKTVITDSLLIVFILLNVAYRSSGFLSWKLGTSTVVFGQDLKLVCQFDDDTFLKRIRQWSKGTNDKLLVNNGTSINSSKYSEELDLEERTSILTVKLIDIHDVNTHYTCQHGFNKYKKWLNITVENFEYTTPRLKKNQIAGEFGHALFTTIFAFCVLLCVTFLIISRMSNIKSRVLRKKTVKPIKLNSHDLYIPLVLCVNRPLISRD